MQTFFNEEGYPLALRATYLASILGSVGSHQYQRYFGRRTDGSLIDVTDGGNFSCAVYVSSILTLCYLTTGGVHTTVDETVRDMCESGWYPIALTDRREGSIILWDAAGVCSDGRKHRHIGFSIGCDEAISNGPQSRVPQRHHVTFGIDDEGKPVRPIVARYFHADLARDI